MRKNVFFLGLLTLLTGCMHKMPMAEQPPFKLALTPVPLTPFHWQVEYDGGGSVQFNPDGSGDLIFSPQVPKTSAQTFSALLLLRDSILHPIKNYAVRIEVTTVRQLRESTPNEWEIFWFFGNYRRSQAKSGKTTNYFLAKPNSGIEVGRAFEDVGQHFLKTVEGPDSQIGQRHSYLIIKRNQTVSIYKEGRLVLEYHGGVFPDSLYDQTGSLGLYSEDALVRVHSFSYQSLD